MAKVTLNWGAVASPVPITGHVIERRVPAGTGTWELRDLLDGTARSFTDPNLPDGSYGYRVAADNTHPDRPGSGVGAFSDEVVVTVDTTPEAPAPYTPADAPGVLHWWPVAQQDATTDGEPVEVLVDAPGARDVPANGGVALPYRPSGFAPGRPAIGFDAPLADINGPAFAQAASDLLNGADAYTIAIAVRGKSAAAKGYAIGKLYHFGLTYGPDSKVQLLLGDTAGTGWSVNQYSTATMSPDANHVLTLVRTPTTAVVRLDGTQIISVGYTSTPASPHGFAIGALNENGAEVWHGALGDPFIGSQALAGTDLTALENYLRASMGLATT